MALAEFKVFTHIVLGAGEHGDVISWLSSRWCCIHMRKDNVAHSVIAYYQFHILYCSV